MESMVPNVTELLAAPGDDGGENEGEEAAAIEDEEMLRAVMLNAQLKQMLAQAEAAQAAQEMRRQQPPPRKSLGSRPRGGAAQSSQHLSGQARRGGWGGTTHTESRSNEIDRDNQILVQKLSNIAIKPTLNTRQNQPFRQNPVKTSVAINRRRQDDKIARENAALARRLNSVKPTSNLSNKTAQQHAKRHTNYLRVLGGAGSVGSFPAQPLPPARARPSSSNRALPALRLPTEVRPFE